VRIEHVPAARVLGRRREREVGRLHDRGDGLRFERMLDADAPGPANPHVSAGVDDVLADAGRVEHVGRAVDRPALDEPGRIERSAGVRVEVAVRLRAELLAPGEDLANLR
jgi:hypothetical protein